MREICFEFRLAQASHPQIVEKVWLMEMVGKLDGVGHMHRSQPMRDYPAYRQQAQFISRARRILVDWFNSADYDEACKRAERKPKLLVIPGR